LLHSNIYFQLVLQKLNSSTNQVHSSSFFANHDFEQLKPEVITQSYSFRFYQSALIRCVLTIDVHDDDEEVTLPQNLFFVESMIDEHHLYVRIQTTRFQNVTQNMQRCYVAKIPLFYPNILYSSIYDRTSNESCVELNSIDNTNPTSLPSIPNGDCSIIICCYNDQRNCYELRKYPFSSMRFRKFERFDDICTEAQLIRLKPHPQDETSIQKIVSNLEFISCGDITKSTNCMDSSRGILYLSDLQGKAVIVDVEALEETEDDEEADDCSNEVSAFDSSYCSKE